MPRRRSAPIRILIVDDHPLARAGMQAMLGHIPHIDVIAEASSGSQALELCQTLHPNLVLLDLRMPGMDGIETTRAIKELDSTIMVVIVSVLESAEFFNVAYEAGASGYILKDASRAEFLACIDQAMGISP